MKNLSKNFSPLHPLMILILISLNLMSGCVNARQNPVSDEIIIDYRNGFSLEYPEGWEIKKKISGTDVMGFSPASDVNDKFHENLSVGHEDLSTVKSLTLDKYFALTESNIKRSVEAFKSISVEDIEFAGVPAKKVIYTFTMGVYRIKGCMILMRKDDTGYIVTATATDETFNEFNPVFTEILNSFKFVPKKQVEPAPPDSELVKGRYLNKKYKFSIEIPKGWDYKDNQSGRIMFLFSPIEDNDNFRENLNIGKEKIPSGISQDEYMKMSVANMKKMVKGLENLGESKLEINGLPARRLNFSFKLNQFEIKGMTYIVFYKDEAFLLTCGMLDSTYDKYEKIMSKIAKSFKIEK